jgi:CspA family cold shock protein
LWHYFSLVSKVRLEVYHVTQGVLPMTLPLLSSGIERGSTMAKGKIKKLISDKGFGFIQTEEGKDLFFHRTELQGVDFDSLKEGQEVEYETSTGRGGLPQAGKVRRTSTP